VEAIPTKSPENESAALLCESDEDSSIGNELYDFFMQDFATSLGGQARRRKYSELEHRARQIVPGEILVFSDAFA
jgi:hypothetical protein